MRYILSMLILLLSLSFFTIACGGDDTTGNGDKACSATNTTGECPDGKTCNNGVCVDNTCTPDCSGKVCGDNGCGGTCGSCDAGKTCNANGQCEAGTNNECSATNPTGTCPAGQTCENGVCKTGTCSRDCAGKTCGDDGCGGTCGSCNVGETCNANGQCVAGCTPNCAGKVCGDDGCGGVCGTCNTGETCNANGQCDVTAGDGELGGNCDQNTPCNDNTNLCLGPQDGQAHCYQACNGANDTSCTQDNYTCQDVPNVGFVCLPNPTGNTPIGGDCSSEACVDAAICLNPDAPTCYEKCSAATDTCQTSGYTCQDTGNADIGWVCAPSSAPGNVEIGGTCDEQNNCVEAASCLGPENGPYTCYEKCTGPNDTCSTADYTCQAAAGANFCLPDPSGTTPIGGDCSQEGCVDAAICLNPNAPTCYEKCSGQGATCSQEGYTCTDSGDAQIGWICWGSAPGNTQIGGDCTNENCVAEASCLSTQDEQGNVTSSICYEKCDPNNGGACSQTNYTCEAVAGGNYCMPPQQ